MIRISKSDPVTQLSHLGEGVVFLFRKIALFFAHRTIQIVLV